MDFNDEREDLADDGRAAAHRERATAMLPEIAQQVKEALTGERIDTSVFFLVPNSGDAIITFGSAVDPPTPNGVEWPMSSPRPCGNRSGSLGRDAEKWCARPPTQLLITPALRKSVQ